MIRDKKVGALEIGVLKNKTCISYQIKLDCVELWYTTFGSFGHLLIYPLLVCNFFCAVCIKYLETHHEERERLYEVEAPGEWSQRCNVWLSIQLQRRQTHSECRNTKEEIV